MTRDTWRRAAERAERTTVARKAAEVRLGQVRHELASAVLALGDAEAAEARAQEELDAAWTALVEEIKCQPT